MFSNNKIPMYFLEDYKLLSFSNTYLLWDEASEKKIQLISFQSKCFKSFSLMSRSNVTADLNTLNSVGRCKLSYFQLVYICNGINSLMCPFLNSPQLTCNFCTLKYLFRYCYEHGMKFAEMKCFEYISSKMIVTKGYHQRFIKKKLYSTVKLIIATLYQTIKY